MDNSRLNILRDLREALSLEGGDDDTSIPVIRSLQRRDPPIHQSSVFSRLGPRHPPCQYHPRFDDDSGRPTYSPDYGGYGHSADRIPSKKRRLIQLEDDF